MDEQARLENPDADSVSSEARALAAEIETTSQSRFEAERERRLAETTAQQKQKAEAERRRKVQEGRPGLCCKAAAGRGGWYSAQGQHSWRGWVGAFQLQRCGGRAADC